MEIGFNSAQDWISWAKKSDLKAYHKDLPLLAQCNSLWPDEEVLLTYAYEFEDEPDWWKEGSAITFWKGFAKGFMATYKPA